MYESAAVNLDSCDVFRSIQDPTAPQFPSAAAARRPPPRRRPPPPQMDGRHSIPRRHDPDVVGRFQRVY